VRFIDDQAHECFAAERLREAPGLRLGEPHERRLEREARVHAQAERDLQRLDRVVAAIGIAREVRFAHAADQYADAAPVGRRAGEGEEEQVAPGYEGVRQARGLHADFHVVRHRGGAEPAQHVELQQMIAAEARRPARKFAPQPREDARPAIELGAVALPVVEADGLDARVALERPGQADGRILAAGEQN
jgi:hypothetical protein